MKKIYEPEPVNLTPMIDIVFQMIIFFVTTIEMDREKFKDDITLAEAPHGAEVEEVEPSTMFIQVDKDGIVWLGPAAFSKNALAAILKQQVGRQGQNMPVVIRGAANTPHAHIRDVMNICSGAGLWQINLSALKEKRSDK